MYVTLLFVPCTLYWVLSVESMVNMVPHSLTAVPVGGCGRLSTLLHGQQAALAGFHEPLAAQPLQLPGPHRDQPRRTGQAGEPVQDLGLPHHF